MFDVHIHSCISFDGKGAARQLAGVAAEKGLKEICFTDHMDYTPLQPQTKLHFTMDEYHAMYDDLQVPGILIGRGVEFGMLPDNTTFADRFLSAYPFDYVIGSAHFVNGYDPYYPPYWEGKTQEQAELEYLEEVLACVRAHSNFDALGHLTYISKTRPNPTKRPVPYELCREVADEVLKLLVEKGKALEINTSGMDRCGDFIPQEVYLRRFRELGGEMVVVGSDAHSADRVGQYCVEACRLVADLFGYVCTFRRRKPVFHKI